MVNKDQCSEGCCVIWGFCSGRLGGGGIAVIVLCNVTWERVLFLIHNLFIYIYIFG